MATILYIGESGDPSQFSITENGRFDIRSAVTLNEQGKPDTLETFIEIEGDLTQGGVIAGQNITATTAGVYDATELVQHQLTTLSLLAPRHFYVVVDGATKFDFPPSSCINSPIITSFRTITDTGAGDAHWKYAMTVYIRQLGSVSNQNMLEFQSSIATTSIVTDAGERPIRKHWSASAKAANANTALTFIKTLAPSAPSLVQTYTRIFQEGRAAGDWVWDYNQNQKIEEDITVTGLGPTFTFSTQVGAQGEDVMPLIHRKPRAPIVVLLEGTISSTNPALVTLPQLHWSENDDFHHDLGEERVGERVIYDDMRGLYKLKYQERWIGRRYVPPNHHDHDVIPALPEPSDGAIGGLA